MELIQEHRSLFKGWTRYVDDVWCVIRKRSLKRALEVLNGKEPTIKFTHEVEEDSKLPFLEVVVIRKEGALEFEIYRKSTHGDLYINKNSFNPPSHKLAAFNSMIYRMRKVPMSKENLEKERETILKIAEKNGYERNEIEKLMEKNQILKEEGRDNNVAKG